MGTRTVIKGMRNIGEYFVGHWLLLRLVASKEAVLLKQFETHCMFPVK